jgi:hypothetical protein
MIFFSILGDNPLNSSYCYNFGAYSKILVFALLIAHFCGSKKIWGNLCFYPTPIGSTLYYLLFGYVGMYTQIHYAKLQSQSTSKLAMP